MIDTSYVFTPLLHSHLSTLLGNILPDIPMFRQLVHHAANETDAANAKPAIVDANGSYTYRQLLADINAVRQKIAPSDLNEQRVAALCTPGYNYVVTQWAVWAAGGVFVPLCILHTQPEVAHYTQNNYK
ncbi:hypothetical protein BDF19DRAFT_494665 [Syncephalis fuscata]|nr:hypothetical protein BDF19DRAFT_494665 [Syncephalis fuscata]